MMVQLSYVEVKMMVCGTDAGMYKSCFVKMHYSI